MIDGKTYTPFNNYYKWRGGAFDTTLLIPQVASPNGKRPGAIYYNSADSSVYSWTGSQWRKVSGDTTSLSNRINLKLNISDTAAMLNKYKFTAANGLTKDSTVFRLGGSLNQNTSINLNSRRLSIIGGSDTTRFFSNGRVSIGGTPDSSFMLNVNGDSRVTGAIYQRFGTDSTDFPRSQSVNILVGNQQPQSRRGILIGSGTFNNTNNVSIGIGQGVNVGTGTGNVAIGYTSIASNGGVAISSNGNSATATNLGVAIGFNSNANGGVAILGSATNGGVGVGLGANGNGVGATAIGPSSSATGNHAVSVGDRVTANNNNSIALGLYSTTTSFNQLVIGGNDVSNAYGINDVYIGSGVRNASKLAGKDVTYNGSGAGDSTNMAGGNITIAGGKGTGNGTPGSVIFSTSSTLGSGTTLQTLTERARISDNGNLLINTTNDNFNRYKLNANGNGIIGNLEIMSNNNASTTGQGIRIDGPDNSFRFQGSGQSGVPATFIFEGWQTDTVPTGAGLLSKDIIRISQGLRKDLGSPSIDTGRFNILHVRPKLDIRYDSGHSIVRGIYYNPIVQNLNKTSHIAYQNTTGSNLLNSSFGNTRIGYNTNDTTFKLDVNGQSRFANHVNITNGGYLKIPDNNKIQLGVNGPSQNYNTFITSVVPSSEGARNTHIGYVDGYTGNSGTGNTIIGSVNNRSNVTGNDNVIVGVNNRNYISGTGTQNTSIIIGTGMYTPDEFNTNQVGYFGFDGGAIGGTLSSHLGFFSGSESRESNAIVFGRSGAGNVIYNNVYFNGVKAIGIGNGSPIVLNAAGGADTSNRSGGNITIAGGKGTGNGTPGAVIFSTSSSLTSPADSMVRQTLSERARISTTGSLLVNRQSQPTLDTIYKLDVNGSARVSNNMVLGGSGAYRWDIHPANITASGDALDINGNLRTRRINIESSFGGFDSTSILAINSTTQGFLQPRMTNTQRDAISTAPPTGLQVFSTTDSANYVYRGTGGGWQKIANEISGSASLDFPSTGHGTSSDLSFTVTGASEGDVVSLGIPNSAMVANVSYTAWVSAADTVTVRLDHYASSGNVDPVSATFKVKVFK